MCDDDSFNVETVPRYAILGAQTGTNDGDNESTLGDRFFVCFYFNFIVFFMMNKKISFNFENLIEFG